MGPRSASLSFSKKYCDAISIRVTLYGSLAATGKGHLTDTAINKAIPDKPLEIIWKPDEELPLHTNGMLFEALDSNGNVIGTTEEYSVGGGALLSDQTEGDIYQENFTSEILDVVEKNYGTFWEFIESVEGEEIYEFLLNIWNTMDESIRNGLKNKGTLPGKLKLPRKAHSFHSKSAMLEKGLKDKTLLGAYAYAVSEENASGGIIVTAPTCGASGVVPAILQSLKERMDLTEETIIHALATAGLFGNIVKENGSISGAYVGCQGEVGVACAMAAAAACQIMGGTPKQIGYAAEMGLEHHLGLTCDPVYGLVQIPCIERNAHAALRALDCAHFAILSDGTHRISFDDVVEVMLETGKAMSKNFKETSQGGLAKVYQLRIAKYADED
jgi:L-serine dehydratase